jgi:hypothetical protein
MRQPHWPNHRVCSSGLWLLNRRLNAYKTVRFLVLCQSNNAAAACGEGYDKGARMVEVHVEGSPFVMSHSKSIFYLQISRNLSFSSIINPQPKLHWYSSAFATSRKFKNDTQQINNLPTHVHHRATRIKSRGRSSSLTCLSEGYFE